jgi:hypothetical protein
MWMFRRFSAVEVRATPYELPPRANAKLPDSLCGAKDNADPRQIIAGRSRSSSAGAPGSYVID